MPVTKFIITLLSDVTRGKNIDNVLCKEIELALN